MAVDTATKRSSALFVRTRSRRFLPVPDGAITVADRAHLARVYYEVAAGSTVTVYPNGDGNIGDWTDQTGFGTTNLWAVVDEPVASPDDANYIQAATVSTISPIFLLLENMPGDFGTMGSTIVVKFRGRHLTGGDFGPVQIFQSDETTALTDTITPTTTGSLANYTLTLNVTGATSKAAWDGARLKFATDNSLACDLQVTAVQVDITYTAGGGGGSGPGYGTNQNASIFLAI